MRSFQQLGLTLSLLNSPLTFALDPDTCPGYNIPQHLGETDEYTYHGCFVPTASGFFQAGMTFSELLSDSIYGMAWMAYYD